MKTSRREFVRQSAKVVSAAVAVPAVMRGAEFGPDNAPSVGRQENPGFRDWARPLTTEFVTVLQWPAGARPKAGILSDAPSLVSLPNGRLLCSIPFYSWDDQVERVYGKRRCLVFVSDDKGATWKEAARLPVSCGRFFRQGHHVHFVGAGPNRDGLHIATSLDGESWQKEVRLFEGRFYSAATGYAIREKTLYWAIDGSVGSKRGVFALAADLDADLRNPAAWRKSKGVTHPGVPQLFGKGNHNGGVMLEPNVICYQGTLSLAVRLRINATTPDHTQVLPNVAAICDLRDDDGLELAFLHYQPFPGAQNQFHIIHDPVTNLHWMTCNSVTGLGHDCWHGWGNERRFLMLHYGVDGRNWFPAGCLASWPATRQSLNYCSLLIDGDDLLFVSRTGQRSSNQHDNDSVTFHRLTDFQSLAVNLFPVTGKTEK